MDTNNGFVWVILIIAIFFGGFGGNGWQRSSVQDNYVLTSDMSALSRQMYDGFNGVERGIDTIRNGLCDGFYTTAQQFNATNMNIMQGHNDIERMISDCCCKNAMNTRDIIDNANANTRAILEAMCNEKIERLRDENYALKLSASQIAQNAYLISQLKPVTVGATA